MLDLGTVKPGSTIYIPVNTFDSNDPSASVTITNWANTDCHVHKDGGTTQRASSVGETLSIDFDSIAGNHLLAIDLADNTTANFYEAGSVYHVRIEGTTVDAATVNAWIAMWRIGYPGAILDTTLATLASQTSFTLEEGPADNDALNGSLVVIHDLASSVQIAQALVSDYVGSTKTVTLAADPGIFTMAAGDNASFFPAHALAVWDRLLAGNTHNVTNSAGRRLRQVEAAFVLHSGTAQAGASNTITLDTGANATDDFYNHARVVITGNTGVEQERIIVDYVGSTKVAIIAPPWITTPDATSEFEIEPALCHAETNSKTVDVGLAQAGAVGTITLASTASATDDFYNDDVVMIDAGTGAGQERIITDYNGTTKVAIIEPNWITNPDTTSEYIVEEALSVADVIAISHNIDAADKLEAWMDSFVTGAFVGTPTTISLDTDLAEATSQHYRGSLLVVTSGVAIGQVRPISTYIGGTKVISINPGNPFIDAPVATDTFIIVSNPIPYTVTNGGINVEEWRTNNVDATFAGIPLVDIKYISGDLAAADNLELDYDGTGYDKANSTIGTVTANADMRGTDSAATAAALATTDAVVDAILAMLDDARAEPGQGAPPVDGDLATKIDYLYKWTRNLKDNDGSTTQFYNDAATVVDQKQTTSESGGTVTKAEIVTGP